MLGWFIQESRSSIDRGGVRHIALAVDMKIGLVDVLGSFDFGVLPYIIRFLARRGSAFYSFLEIAYC